MMARLTALWICASAFAVFVKLSSPAIAQDRSRESLRKEIAHARELIFQGNYTEAIRNFSEMAGKYTESPAGDFYKAVALTWKSYVDAKLESGSRAFDGEIEGALVSAIKKAEAINARADKSKEDEIEALYYLGSAYAMRSRLSLYQNHAIPAARFARTAQNHFDALMKLAPDYRDAYFAPGIIYYRVGLLTDSSLGRVATAMLGPKALPAGDLKRGLEYLKTAAERGPLTSVDAKFALVEIYTLNENRFDEAAPLARELQMKYPDNQTFARYLLRIYLGLKDRARLVQTAQQILARVKQGKPNFGPFMKAEAERFLAK